MHIILLISIGFLLGSLNSIAIKWTIKKMVENKNSIIVFLSFFIRISIIFLVFYIFLNRDWRNAVFMLTGLTIAKIVFIIREKKDFKK